MKRKAKILLYTAILFNILFILAVVYFGISSTNCYARLSQIRANQSNLQYMGLRYLSDRNVEFIDANYVLIINETEYARQARKLGREHLDKYIDSHTQLDMLSNEEIEKEKECRFSLHTQQIAFAVSLLLSIIISFMKREQP